MKKLFYLLLFFFLEVLGRDICKHVPEFRVR